MSDPAAEFDGPWKEALELYFHQFIELFFPEIDRDTDWQRELEWQDKELPKIAPAAALGTGIVDKLVKVWKRDGAQECVFIHIEVQAQNDPNLPQRMYQYNHRLEDCYGHMPVSLAVLGDISRKERPSEFRAGRWGCEVKFTFPIAKLSDWRDREQDLEELPNAFSPFILAHLKTLETDNKPQDRLTWKSRIVKRLYDRGMSQADLLQMFRLIDWMMTLPPNLHNQFERELEAFEEERKMPVIYPCEQRWLNEGIAKGQAKGRLDGLLAGIEALLEIRFGDAGVALMPRVRQIPDAAVIERLLRESKTVLDLAAFAALLPVQPTA